MQTVAADAAALQSVGQLPGEKHVAQFAVAVRLDVLPRRLSSNQILCGGQQREVDVTKTVQECRNCDHSARTALLQPVQEQVGEQEVTQVVYAKRQAKALLCTT